MDMVEILKRSLQGTEAKPKSKAERSALRKAA
jgi:hypothetical protein